MINSLSNKNKKKAAKEFSEFWSGKGYEKGECQPFWIELLGKVFGVDNPSRYIQFEDKVHIDHTSFIDAYIPDTKVLIEQKSLGKDLDKPIYVKGKYKTPFQQAKEYSANLPYSRRPRWIITCNFGEFYIYDMENPNAAPDKLLLKNLSKEYYRLEFLVDPNKDYVKKEVRVSVDAGKIVASLYNALKKQYDDPDSTKTLHSLNILCVRLVFCLYAEDSDVFNHNQFRDYLKDLNPDLIRSALLSLFDTLNTPKNLRNKYLRDQLKAFPFVNGGLFEDKPDFELEIPQFTEEIKQILVSDASEGFDWSEISPTVFGAVFESTLNPETRRKGGMHYTSIENIHRVIDPLFLNDLRDELEDIKSETNYKTQKSLLDKYTTKLSHLKFLDPACGSGNFLTETYLSLRNLENEAISLYKQDLLTLDMRYIIKVSINQFYGIEINDFAVEVSKTALWIAENQMLQRTSEIIQDELKFLPLKSNTNIYHESALRTNWNDIVSNDQLDYIIGNPPFIGQDRKTVEQKNEMQSIFGKGASENKLDYVICWYKCAAEYMKNTSIKSAFVSTNSICQGESVPTFWKNLIESGIIINFAFKSFKWSNASSDSAQVYCVIIGFSYLDTVKKYLYTEQKREEVLHINAYLMNSNDVWLQSRVNKPLNKLPKMTKGSEPTDGGYLFLTEKEKRNLINKYPVLDKYIKPFIGAKEFTQNPPNTYSRYCFWFKNGNPSEYIHIKEIKYRLEKIREKRLKSTSSRIIKMAEYPYLFCQERQPDSDYLVFPRHTTSDREYIPFGYISKYVIVGDSCTITKGISLYEFGLLCSSVHMIWTETVCGRLGNEYRYTQSVYNNFPIPLLSDKHKYRIEKTAKSILTARALYPDCSYSTLYDKLSMPPELRKAHQENDKAVLNAYGLRVDTPKTKIIELLMKMYTKIE